MHGRHHTLPQQGQCTMWTGIQATKATNTNRIPPTNFNHRCNINLLLPVAPYQYQFRPTRSTPCLICEGKARSYQSKEKGRVASKGAGDVLQTGSLTTIYSIVPPHSSHNIEVADEAENWPSFSVTSAKTHYPCWY